MIDYRLDDHLWQGQRIFLLVSVSRPTAVPTEPPMQRVSGLLSPGVKRNLGTVAGHSPSSRRRSNTSSAPHKYQNYVLGTAVLYMTTITGT